MLQPKKRLTVIVVPQTGRRTVSFQFSPVWAALLGTILLVGVVALAITAGVQMQANRALRAELSAELAQIEPLRRTTRLQQAEIDKMTSRAKETEAKLTLLQRLEEQIRELTGSPVQPSRGDFSTSVLDPRLGRGGPADGTAALDNVPTLGTVLPAEVRGHLFATRDGTALAERRPGGSAPAPADTLAAAQTSNAAMENQLLEMDRLIKELTDGKTAVQEHLDYLAHRPTGIPISGAVITDRFGSRWSPFGWGWQRHNGIDLAQNYGTAIVSSGKGTVSFSGWMTGGYGYAVVIEHGHGLSTLYAHMMDTNVSVGDEVDRGDLIGWVGSSGSSTGPHLHYEVHLWGTPVDPTKYF